MAPAAPNDFSRRRSTLSAAAWERVTRRSTSKGTSPEEQAEARLAAAQKAKQKLRWRTSGCTLGVGLVFLLVGTLISLLYILGAISLPVGFGAALVAPGLLLMLLALLPTDEKLIYIVGYIVLGTELLLGFMVFRRAVQRAAGEDCEDGIDLECFGWVGWNGCAALSSLILRARISAVVPLA